MVEDFDFREWIIFGGIVAVAYSIIIFLIGNLIGITFSTLTGGLELLPFFATILGIVTVGMFVVIAIVEIVKWTILGFIYHKFLFKTLKPQEVFTKWFLLNSIWIVGLNVLSKGFSLMGIIFDLILSAIIIYILLYIFKYIKYKTPFEVK